MLLECEVGCDTTNSSAEFCLLFVDEISRVRVYTKHVAATGHFRMAVAGVWLLLCSPRTDEGSRR